MTLVYGACSLLSIHFSTRKEEAGFCSFFQADLYEIIHEEDMNQGGSGPMASGSLGRRVSGWRTLSIGGYAWGLSPFCHFFQAGSVLCPDDVCSCASHGCAAPGRRGTRGIGCCPASLGVVQFMIALTKVLSFVRHEAVVMPFFRKVSVSVYSEGLLYRRGSRTRAVRWEDITAVTRMWRVERSRGKLKTVISA